MQLSDFDFDLPDALIAQFPTPDRAGSRLLEVGPAERLFDHGFRALPTLLAPGDLLVVNDTKVLRARLLGSKFGSGGRIEALIERVTGEFTALSQLRASKTPRPGTQLYLHPAGGERPADDRDNDLAEVIGRQGEFFELRFRRPVLDVLERCGRTPLPPYITHTPDHDDDRRYQTVYAREVGAVAAPTAGLHFDEPLFEALRVRGVHRAAVTLHVGAGTFQPVRVEDLSRHEMHQELYSIPAETVEAIRQTRAAGGRVVAVGTTTMRALESASSPDGELTAGAGATRLFVTPGYRFRTVDRLVTNFHLPRSTLLMLVSAFAGVEPIRRAYRHAIEHRYRFFSYGDAMLLTRQDS